jgi:RNA polymerase sigma factor (sigma-70 family)
LKKTSIYSRGGSVFTDKKIMEGIRNGDNVILEYVYTEYLPKVLKYLLKKQLLTADDIYDIFHESMIVCWENIRDDKVDFQRKFFPYLLGICLNLFMMRLRQEDNKAIVMETEHELIPVETGGDMFDLYPVNNIVYVSDEEIKSEIFCRCFNKLKDDCKRLLKLAYTGVDLSEIAKRMRYDVSFLYLKKHRCKEYLREIIKQDKWYSLLKKQLK